MTEATTQSQEHHHHPHSNRRKAMTLLAVVFLLIAFVWLVYWLIWGRFEEDTEDAYVGGNIIQVMSQVPGTVTQINTDDTQLVTQGQIVVALDPADTEIALQRAEAGLADTVRKVRQDFENAETAQTAVILRGSDLLKAQLDLKRRTGLVGERAISKEEMQHYDTATKVAEAQYNAALHNLRAALAVVENSHLYSNPMVERAKTALKSAYLNRQRTTILAPVTGYVAKRSVQLGQQVALNSALLAIVPLDQVWVDANFKESQLSRIRIGQLVTLYSDAYGSIAYHGKVLGLSPGTGVVFSLLPPQNATGNWIKIVQRLPVRIGLDADELKKNPLLIGLSMRVTINTYHADGSRLATVSNAKPLYVTTVYDSQLALANTLIDTILQENSPNLFVPRLQLNESISAPAKNVEKSSQISMLNTHRNFVFHLKERTTLLAFNNTSALILARKGNESTA